MPCPRGSQAWLIALDQSLSVAALVAVFAGPNQSASRSLMGRFVPRKHQAAFCWRGYKRPKAFA